MIRKHFRAGGFCLGVALLSGLLCAQEYRATVAGNVTDPSGAAIPNVTVKATRVGTADVREAVTNSTGYYTLPYLVPATYEVEYQAKGFQTLKRTGIVLQVNDRLDLSVQLNVGDVNTAITVDAQQEIIQTATASRGLVFDPIKMQEIPLNGRQAYMLMRLSPGVMFTQRTFGEGGFSGTRGWDVNGAFTMNGGRVGTNQFLLDGAPISTDGTFNLAPNVEAVQEMKVMVNTYDSQYGRSGGGHVSTTIKSGTNEWHGTLFEFWRNRVLDANSFQSNRVGAPRGFRNQHQFGGTAGGFIRKNRDYIFGSFEGWRELVPFPNTTTVPPVPVRGGDFSSYIPQGQSAVIRIYDPLTSRQCGVETTCPNAGGGYIRTQFAGNVIPGNRISPVGRNIMGYWPSPNVTPLALANNFTRPDNVGRYRYEQPIVKWDHIFGDNDRLNVRWTFQDGSEYRNGNGFDAPAQTGNMPGTVRRDQNYIASYDKTLSATRLLKIQASYGRFEQNFPDVSDPDFTWDKVGIRNIPQVDSFPTRLMPRVVLSGFADIFGNQFLNESSRQQLNFQANLAETRGRHSLKYGFEWAQIIRHNRASGRSSGQLEFNGIWSRQYRNVGQGVLDGNSIADLLLGNMSGGFIAFNDTFLRREPYIAGFFQDDWKVNSKLTLNLGARYDIQFPLIEIQNRLLNGFDFESIQPTSDAILANWRASVGTAGYPAPPPSIRGGPLYAGVRGNPRQVYAFDFTNIQPRIGFAWQPLNKTVIRGGYGIFYRTVTQGNVATGFSLNTSFINSLDGDRTPAGGLTGASSLENPFPNGVVRPPGSAGGIQTNFGGGLGFDNRNRPLPPTHQASFTIERELPWSQVVEVSYVYSKTLKEVVTTQLSDMSRQFFDDAQNPDRVTFYQQTVPNPFFGVVPRTVGYGASPVISRRELLRRLPGWQGLQNFINPWGSTWYNGLQVRYEKRAFGDRSKAGALTYVLSYTWSKNMERRLYDEFSFEWRSKFNNVVDFDRTHNLTFAGVWDLPFGKGRALASNLPKVAEFVIGGWTTNMNFIYQTGVPIGAWRGWEYNEAACGSPVVSKQTESQWFYNQAGRAGQPAFNQCWRQLRPFEYQVLPFRFHSIRQPTAPQFDFMLSKRFRIRENLSLEFRGEAFNATNTPIRGDVLNTGNPAGGGFGELNARQVNFPRNVQLGARIRW
jgi:hypothetical protein